MRKWFLGILLLILSLSLTADEREVNIDFIILFDTSLSMESTIKAARTYVAEEIIAPLTENGDWVCLVKFYGKAEIVTQMQINADSEKVELIRTLNQFQANGRFTDIGNALDTLDKLIIDRGHPERPKYILLVTDERQEAPKNTKYYSPTFTINHPLLEFVKRVDMGPYRVITIGYGVSTRIEGSARNIFTTLAEPPVRLDTPLPGSTQGANVAQGSQPGENASQRGSPASSGAKRSASLMVTVLTVSGLLGLTVLVLVLIVIARKRKSEKQQERKNGR